MRLKFTKMQGAGNDFVVLDGVRQRVSLTRAQWRALADRHFGVGADQLLLVEPPDGPDGANALSLPTTPPARSKRTSRSVIPLGTS